MKLKNYRRKIIAGVLSLILISQIFIINYIINIYKDFNDNQDLINTNELQIDSMLINDTVKNEQEYMISSIRQSLEQYSKKNINLLLNYSNETETINYNPKTMIEILSREKENTYDIKDINTNNLLIKNAKPEWNIPILQDTLNMLIAPVKNFGNHGGFIVYDSNSGKIFLDTTPANRIKDNDLKSIFEDDKDTSNKNPENCKSDIDEYLKQKNNEHFIYMYNENKNMKEEKDDFIKYPLGNYKRQFVYMDVLPYKTIGFDGQKQMQLTVLSIVDEQDVFNKFKAVKNDIKHINVQNEKNYNDIFICVILNITITMLSMIAALYVLVFKDKNNI